MYRIFISIFILLALGCKYGNDADFDIERITTRFFTSDTNNIEKTTFKSQEEFIVKFEVNNKSGSALKYYSPLPVLSYDIIKGDSIICSSTDLMTYAAMMINSEIKNGDSYTNQWFAPNTLGRLDGNEIISLLPGIYQINVNHKYSFEEYNLPKTKLISIEIIDY